MRHLKTIAIKTDGLSKDKVVEKLFQRAQHFAQEQGKRGHHAEIQSVGDDHVVMLVK